MLSWLGSESMLVVVLRVVSNALEPREVIASQDRMVPRGHFVKLSSWMMAWYYRFTGRVRNKRTIVCPTPTAEIQGPLPVCCAVGGGGISHVDVSAMYACR